MKKSDDDYKLNMFFWGPVVTGLLSYSDIKNISFIDLVHAHEAMEIAENRKVEFIKMIGESIGKT